MVLSARLEDGDHQAERRSANRRMLKLHLPGATDTDTGVPVLIHDISSFGILIQTTADLASGTVLDIDFPQVGAQAATIVWNRDEFFGCEFETPLSKAGVSAALLKGEGYGGSFHSFEPQAADAQLDSDKLPLRTRLLSILALGLACWIVLVAAYFFLKS